MWSLEPSFRPSAAPISWESNVGSRQAEGLPAPNPFMLAGFYFAPISLLGGPQQDALPDSLDFHCWTPLLWQSTQKIILTFQMVLLKVVE